MNDFQKHTLTADAIVRRCQAERANYSPRNPVSFNYPLRAIEQSRRELNRKVDQTVELATILKELEGYDANILESMFLLKVNEKDWENKEVKKAVRERKGL